MKVLLSCKRVIILQCVTSSNTLNLSSAERRRLLAQPATPQCTLPFILWMSQAITAEQHLNIGQR